MISKIDLIVDMQYGSTGKGLVASYLCAHRWYECVISANMPNAGHTAYDQCGNKFVHKVLPSGVFNTPAYIMIGPGAVFDPARLEKEVHDLQVEGHLVNSEILIHAQATVLTPEMRDREASSAVTKIASTAQGSMVAMVARMQRDPDNNPTAGSAYYPTNPLIRVIPENAWGIIVQNAQSILAEGAQGYSLGISSDFYPYTTSRDCTPARFLSDMSLPIRGVKIIGVCRTFPIRVGNTDQGQSGPHYSDQKELTWEQVGQPEERTTVTGRVRRVFSFSQQQFEEALRACTPDEVFLNFANYLDEGELSELLGDMQKTARKHGSWVCYLGYGPMQSGVVRVENKDSQL